MLKVTQFKKSGFTWYDAENPTKKELAKLSSVFGVTPKDILAATDEHERPRTENRKSCSILIFRMPYASYTKVISFLTLLGKKNVATVHFKPIITIGKFTDICKINSSVMTSPTQFVISLFDFILREFFTVLSEVEQTIDKLESMAINNPESNTINYIFKTKKVLIYFRNALNSNREVITSIEKNYVNFVEDNELNQFRVLYDDIMQLIEMDNTYRDIITGTLDIYLTSVSNNMNQIIKKMTAYGSLILVPTLISGIYGMNFRHIPLLDSPNGFYISLLMMLSSVVALYWYFERKKWL